MFADKNLSYEELKKEYDLKLTEDEFVQQTAENALSVEIFLSGKKSILNVQDCQDLHKIMNQKVDENAGVINGKRWLSFFNNNGHRNMVVGNRLKKELSLLDLQVRKLMKRAGNSKEDKIKALCIHAMRLFSIHPFNDGNKRIVKTMIRHYIEKEFKILKRPQWKDISRKVINQAVRGNNIGPLARNVCDSFNINYNPQKISEIEISPYRIYPDTGKKTYTLGKELRRATIRLGEGTTFKELVFNRQELKSLGIQSSFFKKNTVCETLLEPGSSDSLLRKVKMFHSQNKLTDQQATELVKKLIFMTDGSDGKNCDLATKKILKTEMSDIKKAVRFYEKEAVIKDYSPGEGYLSLENRALVEKTQKINSNIKIR